MREKMREFGFLTFCDSRIEKQVLSRGGLVALV